MNGFVIEQELDFKHETILHILREKARTQPDQTIYTFLPDGQEAGPTLDYRALDDQSRRIAAHLEALQTRGQRAILLYPPGLDLIPAFFGCLYSGVTAIPGYLPDPAHLEQGLLRLQGVLADGQVSVALTTSPVVKLLRSLAPQAVEAAPLKWVITDTLPGDEPSGWESPLPKPGDLAYLQYTSGSTRNPRGVMLTHANLIHNTLGISRKFALSEEDTAVIWLPAQHNMGLIGGILQPFFSGVRCILMPPQVFLQNPLLWLKAISRFKATVSGGPNFAYDLCVHRIPAEARHGLDLSSWDLAFNGAEPVRAETIEAFSAAYAPFGFKKQAFFPCYGLAEATLLASGGERRAGPVIFHVEKAPLLEKKLVLQPQPSPRTKPVVGCGTSLPGQQALIVDPETCVPAAPGQAGELWLSGPSIANGYWNHPQETAETFQGYLAPSQAGPYLRTGDLACTVGGEVLIVGRIKDLIIIRGRNHYPQDIEKTVESCHPALIPGGGAAFSVDMAGEEQLVIVQEVDPRARPDFAAVCSSIRQAVSLHHDLAASKIVLVEPFSIPKTVSGKVPRQACRKLFLEGGLKTLHTSTIKPVPSGADLTAAAKPAREGSLLHDALLALGPEKGQSLLLSHLAGRIAGLLNIAPAQVEPGAPLTDLGLDSISSVELAEAVESALGVRISLESIYKGATLQDLAAQILAGLGGAGAPPAPGAEPPEETREYPLTHGQRALWFVQQLTPESAAHNIVYGAVLHPETDLQALRGAFGQVVERHATLRSTFHEKDGQVIQRVHPHGEVPYELVEASAWSPAELDERIAAEVFRPFNLQTGPLIRVTLFRQSAERTIIILALHHIVTDLWSMAVFLHELGLFYAAELSGSPAEIKPMPCQYADHVQWEAEMLAGPDGEAHWAYWKERLSGDLPVLNLPTDHPRPAVLSARAAAHTFCLGVERTAALKKLSQGLGANLFASVLAAFYALLARYTGQEDLLIGTPKACRNRSNAGVIGYFINPVVIRADLSAKPTYAGFLAQVHKNVQADFQHDAYPFPLLVERLRPKRELSVGSLFQVFYSWQKTNRLVDSRGITAFALGEENIQVDLNGLRIESYPLKDRVTPTDLALLVAESDDDLKMTFEYNVDLFERATIERMSGHLLTILEAVLADPNQPVASLPILTAEETRQLLEEWNRPADDLPEDQGALIHEMILTAAREQPESTALVQGERRLTYRELCERSLALAACLRASGVGPEVVVGVSLERSPEMVTGLLGILMAGGAFLPLDPDFPAERLGYMVADAGVRMILTQAKLAGRLHEQPVQLLCLDSDWPAIEAAAQRSGAAAGAQPEVRPENLAYLMYTSGSTGKPKGVLIPHGAIASHCRFMSRYYELTRQDRILQFASLNFDASLEQIFTCLISGAALCLRDADLWNPAEFSEKIDRLGLTVVNVPPAYWQQWVQAGSRLPEAPANSRLRLVIIGGDVLDPDILRLWERSPYASARLINAYGPTETTITATAYDVPRGGGAGMWRVPIGRPLAGRTAYILDPLLQPQPVGIPGELHIGGNCLARGYLNQPELTRAKFIADPFTPHPGARLYKTGDLAHYLPDGNIVFDGRIDRQIKVRGIRIEPGEVEALLRQHPAVEDGIVFVDEAETGPQLAACLVLRQGQNLDAAQLHDFLSRQLPSYMVPGAIFTRSSLPLTPGGKLDRQEIARSSRLQLSSRPDGYAAPRNELESDLAKLWAEVLHVDRVGIYDDFFALGGHSLLATRLIARIEEQYQVELPLRRLFETPTVAGLALAITQAMAEGLDEQALEALLDEIESETIVKEDGGPDPGAR